MWKSLKDSPEICFEIYNYMEEDTPKRENQVASRFMFNYLSYTAQAHHFREEYCLFLLIIEMTDCGLVVEELIDLISVK